MSKELRRQLILIQSQKDLSSIPLQLLLKSFGLEILQSHHIWLLFLLNLFCLQEKAQVLMRF